MMIRRISIAILVAACCVLAALLLLARRPAIAPIERPAPGSFSPGSVAQGEALAAAGHCASCHTRPGGPAFAGGYAVNTPFGIIYGTNITPDPKTGIGMWSFEAFERAMREGVSRDGSHLFPAFPYYAFTKLSDHDIECAVRLFHDPPAGERQRAGKHTSVSSQYPSLPGALEDPVFQKRTVPRRSIKEQRMEPREHTWRKPLRIARAVTLRGIFSVRKRPVTLTPVTRLTGGSRLR